MPLLNPSLVTIAKSLIVIKSSPYTKKGRQEWINERPRHRLAKPPRKSVCQDAAKIIEPKLDDAQCGFGSGWSTTEQISTLTGIFKKSWDHAKDVYTCFADLGKVHGPGPGWKALGGVVGAQCWQVPLADRQVTIFLLRRLFPCRRS